MSSCGRIASDHQRSTPDAGTGDLAEPHAELDDVAVDRDPLRFGVGGDHLAIGAGAELHADRHSIGEAEREVEAGGVVGGIRDASRGATGRRAARRVEPRPADAAERHLLGAGVQHPRAGKRGEVVCGDGRSHLVGVGRGDLEVDRRQGERVAADAAAEIGDMGDAGSRESSGVKGCNLEPGRLFETGLGEEHARRELTELRPRPGSELRLAEDRGDEACRMPLSAQLRDRAHDVGLRVPLGQRVEQAEALG